MSGSIFFQVIASGLLHALWNFAAKKASGNLAVNWLAQIAGFVILLPFAFVESASNPWHWHDMRWAIGAGLVQSFYFVLLSRAYATGEMSVVYPISRGLGIAGSAMVGVACFTDQLTWLGIAGIGAIVAGTTAIGWAQSRRRTTANTAVFFAMAIALTLVISAYIDKTGVSTNPPVSYLCAVYLISVFTSAPFFLLRYRTGIAQGLTSQKRIVLIVGAGAALSYLIILFTFRSGPLGYVLAVREIAVIAGSMLGFFVLKEEIYATKIAGIAAIALGIAVIKIGG